MIPSFNPRKDRFLAYFSCLKSLLVDAGLILGTLTESVANLKCKHISVIFNFDLRLNIHLSQELYGTVHFFKKSSKYLFN